MVLELSSGDRLGRGEDGARVCGSAANSNEFDFTGFEVVESELQHGKLQIDRKLSQTRSILLIEF